MSTRPYDPELKSLLHISHVLGCNPAYVQAGGGNTSVKSPDGALMIIKASGTPLGALNESRGWVRVDLGIIRTLLARTDLASLAVAARESEVLAVLNQSVVEPREARPSVETPLHALLDAVVMHSHAVAANALSCHPQGETLLSELFEDDRKSPPLWVPYIDPGATLAVRVSEMIREYRGVYGCAPSVMLLQNHGLFVSASTASECVAKHSAVLDRIERFFVNSSPCGIDKTTRDVLRRGLFAVLGEGEGSSFIVRFSSRQELNQAAQGPLVRAFEGALSPDHVVYYGPKALTLGPSVSQAGFERKLRGFRKSFGVWPVVIVIKGQGVCIVGPSEKKLDAAESLALSAVQLAALNRGALRFLAPNDVHFIMNWEAEHYRAKQG